MRGWAVRAAVGVLALVSIGCSSPFGRKYEYEEQVYLRVNGSATVLIDASIAALIALRNLPLDPAAPSSADREAVRAAYTAAGCGNVRVGQPWVRSGRRFVQVQVVAADLKALEACGPLAWSSYRFDKSDTEIHYEQIIGPPPAGQPARLGAVNWDGSELVAFKLHAPSRILYHNVKRLEDGSNGKADRGNILTWEQRLADRRAGQEMHLNVRMGSESILVRTLILFGSAFLGAIAVLATIVSLTIRNAKRRRLTDSARPASGPQ